MAQTKKSEAATTPVQQVTETSTGNSVGSNAVETEIQAEPLTVERVAELLHDKMISWFDTGVALLPNLLIAICLFFIFHAIGAIVGRAALRAFKKAFDLQAVASLMAVIV